jgi:phospholipase C
MDFTAILKFIEKRFSVQGLTARDSNSPDMTEFFDFANPSFMTPPNLPPQPTTGTCNRNLETGP